MVGKTVPVVWHYPILWDKSTQMGDSELLPLTKEMGVPLVACHWDLWKHLRPTPWQYNEATALLSLDCHPASDSFGKPMVRTSIAAYYYRLDGYSLEPRNVFPMLEFIKTELADLVRYGKAETNQTAEAKEQAKAALKKAGTFKEFYEKYRSEHKELEPYEALFDIEKPVCMGCGKGEGMRLMQCGSCKMSDCHSKVSYCSKECQCADWKLHKLVYHK